GGGGLGAGWLGAPVDAIVASTPVPAAMTEARTGTKVNFIRVGLAQPLDDARFPVIVPLLGHGNLAIDADARDSRVVGLLRSLLLRLVASHPPGAIRIKTVDATGTVFGPFQALIPVGGMSAPVAAHAGLRTVPAGAEGR